MSTDNGHVASLADWRSAREDGVLMTLPASGLVARVRHVHLLDLVAQGKVPAGLQALVVEMINATKRTMTENDMKKYHQVVNLVVKAAMVEPQVGNKATKDQLAVDEMVILDRIAIFNHGNVPARRLMKFRPKQEKPVGTA